MPSAPDRLNSWVVLSPRPRNRMASDRGGAPLQHVQVDSLAALEPAKNPRMHNNIAPPTTVEDDFRANVSKLGRQPSRSPLIGAPNDLHRVTGETTNSQ